MGQVPEGNFYAVLEGFFSAAPFSKAPCPSNPAGLAGLNFDLCFLCPETLLFSAWAVYLYTGMNMKLTSCASLFCLGCCLVPLIIVLHNLSSFYCCLQQEGESNVRYSITTRAGNQEIHFLKGMNLRNHYVFLISSCRERLSIKILLPNVPTQI